MEESTSREKILKKVRAALINKSRLEPTDIDFDSSIFTSQEETPELIFAQQFSDIGGQFVFCENEDDFCDSISVLLADHQGDTLWCPEPEIGTLLQKAGLSFRSNAQEPVQNGIAITGCEYLVARTGSVVISSRQTSGRRGPFFADNHLVVARTSQLVEQVKDALKGIKARYGDNQPSMITTITGPSRTADIEKTLVQGAHGPKEIFVFLIDDVPAV
ncbi:MAG: lactate utilization protein [Bacteroidia bacterium]|jgi:L-lactate dehydrogenase complex protein LldG|nr:lactate utilization protein [Bacteroidia bacterium]